ncbi:MAG TPA: hypothetical protein VM940_04250 [Chthoniobacterales bacterium]|nr:hypothetical protein [Chthoniobacterales bacterium]
MADESSAIPLGEVLRAANDLVAAGLIKEYALGGALAAIYYVEPFTTYDADIMFIAAEEGLPAGIPAIYAHLQERGWRVEREHLLVDGFPLPISGCHGPDRRSGPQHSADRIRRRARESLPPRAHHCHRRERWSV